MKKLLTKDNQYHFAISGIKKDNLYLITQIDKNKYMGLTWEFPGSKVE